jgi:hypothetical protein
VISELLGTLGGGGFLECLRNPKIIDYSPGRVIKLLRNKTGVRVALAPGSQAHFPFPFELPSFFFPIYVHDRLFLSKFLRSTLFRRCYLSYESVEVKHHMMI